MTQIGALLQWSTLGSIHRADGCEGRPDVLKRVRMTGLSRAEMDAVFLESRHELERSVRRRVRPPELAADIVQDVYLRWRGVRTEFPDRAEARAYLFRIAANLAIDHHKIEGRRQEILASAEPLNSLFADSPESSALAADHARQIEAALSELPKHCRQILILSRLHGMTHKEIAERLGVSTSLVEKYAIRALMHVRDYLGSLDQLG